MSRDHTKRTCHFCGVRAPQPEMRRAEILVESGRSKSSLSGATIIGAAVGSKSAQRSIVRTLFNTGQRTHLRRREIWVCDGSECGTQAEASARRSEKNGGMSVLTGVVIALILLAVVLPLLSSTP